MGQNGQVAVLAQGAGGLSIALVESSKCQIEAGLNLANDGNDTVAFANVAPITVNLSFFKIVTGVKIHL